ncbi:MAG: HEAT repeat domain-containing protein [Pirellulaceae bacterium]
MNRRFFRGRIVATVVPLCLLTSWLAGCADGPVPEMRSLNPWVRKQWAEDEQFGPTYHRKVADLAALRSSAASLSPADQERIAQELAVRVKIETSPTMRVELVRALGELPTESARTALTESLSDENPKVRVVACKGLGQRPAAGTLETLGSVVASDTDLDVRIAAARELGKFKDPAAAQALRVALDENDAALQSVAMESLRGITGHAEYANSVPAWRDFLDGGNPAAPPTPSLAESLQKYWYWY